jgi:hypothetical protein
MNFTHAMDNNIGEKMKVIIELNNNIAIESTDNENIVRLIFDYGCTSEVREDVVIDDLKLAIRKLTAK